MEIAVGIAYGEDVNKARAALLEMMTKYPEIMTDAGNEPAVVVTGLGSSSVDLSVRAWVKSDDYLSISAALQQDTYETLGKNGIEIPFNQLTVHVNNK